jgi:hypothetical protein
MRAEDLFDAPLALALAGTAQYEIWAGPLFDDGIPGPRLPNAVLLLLITIPLAWRRRAPTVVFALVLAYESGLLQPGDLTASEPR